MTMMDSTTQHDTPNREDRVAWLARLTEIGRAHGFFERLGRRHTALFVQEGDTLLVTFDEAERVFARSEDQLPVGFNAVKRREWSLLNIMSSGQSWFRDPALYAFFDRLVDEDFFESFDEVVFMGCGPMCAYAACAYSVAAPGARVLAINPVATLDREDAPFEIRFRKARRLNFSDRYAFAPDMIEAADRASILFDPHEPIGACHAALFRGTNVTRLPVRWAGLGITAMLESDGALDRVLRKAAAGDLTPAAFAGILRETRRAHAPYIRTLISRATQKGHLKLALAAARHGSLTLADRRREFRRYVRDLEDQIAAEAATDTSTD